MTQDNYKRKLLELLRSGELNQCKPGVLYHLDFYHDDWCNVFKGGVCNCNPDVKVRGSGQQETQEA